MNLGARHEITGRQWLLVDELEHAIWCDATIVVPFSNRVHDTTGKVVNNSAGTTVQGGWTVRDELLTLEITDLVAGTSVPGVTAVWAAAVDGTDTASLHILGEDPFAWLAPHLDVPGHVSTTVPGWLEQDFAIGPPVTLTDAARFGELVLKPSVAGGQLLPRPVPWLPGRLLHAPNATLGFSRPAGDPVVVDRCRLEVLIQSEKELRKVDPGWTVSDVRSITSAWMLASIQADAPGGASTFNNPWSGLIAWISYRHAPQTVTSPPRITLKPGHYRVDLSGHSTATAPSGFDDTEPRDWQLRQDFHVARPASLRPYVAFTTTGDNRLFGRGGGFDPTVAGVGFPAHRDYRTVVRFRAPYVHDMFPTLTTAVLYEDGHEGAPEDLPVTPNAAGESALPDASQVYKTAHGGTVGPDDELESAAVLDPGPATLHLRHNLPGGQVVELDSWALHVSRFANAATHLAWPGTCLTRSYDAAGPHDHKACPTLSQPVWAAVLGVAEQNWRANDVGLDPVSSAASDVSAQTWREGLAGRLLSGDDAGVVIPPRMPVEYATPPPGWRLAPALDTLTGDLDEHSAGRFLSFLRRSGARLSADTTEPQLSAVAEPVPSTRVEAVCAPNTRPLALWIRTPEPLDWRRVNVVARLRHVTPHSGCPTGYAHRRPLDLEVRVVPGVDGSQALLVARFAGVCVAIARGELTLTLTYEAQGAGRVPLRPTQALPGGHEQLSMTFIQPLGSTWPLPSGPHGPPLPVPHPPELFDTIRNARHEADR